MVKTYGLTHISLAVRDPERSLRFYQQVFGAQEMYRDEASIQAQTPGSHDQPSNATHHGLGGAEVWRTWAFVSSSRAISRSP